MIYSIIGLLIVGVLILIYNDDFLYKDEILKIKEVEVVEENTSSNVLGYEEIHYNKRIKGIITNGENRGEEKEFFIEETFSNIVSERYNVGDRVFIEKDDIVGLKRDFQVCLLFAIFIFMMLVVGKLKGYLSIISLIFNIIVFYLGLKLYLKGVNILFLCVIETIIFSISSLFLAGGINKKTISSVICVLITFLVLLFSSLIIVKMTDYKGINFNEISYLLVPPEDIFLPELLTGALGAIMDVAITISSSIDELISKDKNITVLNLKKSVKQIGKDIMSTMCNVLFFTFLCSELPLFVLALRNGISVFNFVSGNFSLELTRFLMGSIGIVLTIPISTYICIKIFKKEKVIHHE